MFYILGICDSGSIVNLIAFIKLFITILTIAVPIILIVTCMLSAFKAMIDGDASSINKLFSDWVRKSIAAIVIFFIPNIAFLVIDLTGSDSEVKNCYQTASFSRAKQMMSSEKANSNQQIEAWKQEQRKKQEEAKKKAEAEREAKKNERNQQKNNKSSYSVGYEANGNKTTSVDLVDVNTTDLGCPVYYATFKKKSLRFNVAVASEVHSVMSKWCSGFVSRSPYTDKIETAGAYVNKKGYHGRGLAVDFYNNWSYWEGNKKYNPYSGQGSATWKRYQTFICEVCNGNENCDKNITYKMYYDYFKPIGWCWGGNWTEGYFDPMHFEKTDGGCSVVTGNRIKCN